MAVDSRQDAFLHTLKIEGHDEFGGSPAPAVPIHPAFRAQDTGRTTGFHNPVDLAEATVKAQEARVETAVQTLQKPLAADARAEGAQPPSGQPDQYQAKQTKQPEVQSNGREGPAARCYSQRDLVGQFYYGPRAGHLA